MTLYPFLVRFIEALEISTVEKRRMQVLLYSQRNALNFSYEETLSLCQWLSEPTHCDRVLLALLQSMVNCCQWVEIPFDIFLEILDLAVGRPRTLSLPVLILWIRLFSSCSPLSFAVWMHTFKPLFQINAADALIVWSSEIHVMQVAA